MLRSSSLRAAQTPLLELVQLELRLLEGDVVCVHGDQTQLEQHLLVPKRAKSSPVGASRSC